MLLILGFVVAPFSPLYAPVLFVCALVICLLKIAAAKVAFGNFTASEQKPDSISINSKPTAANARKQTKSLTAPKIETVFENKKVINS